MDLIVDDVIKIIVKYLGYDDAVNLSLSTKYLFNSSRSGWNIGGSYILQKLKEYQDLSKSPNRFIKKSSIVFGIDFEDDLTNINLVDIIQEQLLVCKEIYFNGNHNLDKFISDSNISKIFSNSLFSKVIELHISMNNYTIHNITRLFPYLQKITLESVENSAYYLMSVLSEIKNLKQIILSGSWFDLDDDDKIIESYTKISFGGVYLNLSNTNISNNVIKKISGVKILILDNTNVNDDALLILSQNNTIEEMRLCGCYLVTDIGICHFRSVRILDLSRCSKIEGYFLTEFNNLKRIYILATKIKIRNILEKVSLPLHNIIYLDISQTNISLKDLKKINKIFDGLEELIVVKCHLLKHNCLKYMQYIKTIDIRETNITLNSEDIDMLRGKIITVSALMIDKYSYKYLVNMGIKISIK